MLGEELDVLVDVVVVVVVTATGAVVALSMVVDSLGTVVNAALVAVVESGVMTYTAPLSGVKSQLASIVR